MNRRPESITRHGKTNETNQSTTKIFMNTKQDKERVMANLKKLKDTEEEFGKIRIADDYTNTEREQIRMWVKKAEEKVQQTRNECIELGVTQKTDFFSYHFSGYDTRASIYYCIGC